MILLTFIDQVYAGAGEGEGTGLGAISGTGKFQAAVLSPSTLLGDFISTIITTLTVFGGLAFVLYFSLGALSWITAGGDKGKVQTAQSQMTQGAIGLIAIIASYFIIGIIGAVLGLDILNPYKTLFPVPAK